MAAFRTHLTVSTAFGVAYGGVAYGLYGVPLSTCLLGGGLCTVAGLAPDLDSGPGVPLRESMAFAAALAPMMLMDRFQALALSQEWMVLCAVGIYLLVRFGLAEVVRWLTAHRGMFHSLPAAVIAAELAYVLSCGELGARTYKAGGVGLGYCAHLLLDELYSIEWYRGRLHLKRTLGTALKIFDTHRLWPNLVTYAQLALLSYLVVYEPGWVEQMRAAHLPQVPAAQAGAQTAASQSPQPAPGGEPVQLAPNEGAGPDSRPDDGRAPADLTRRPEEFLRRWLR